MKFAVIDIIFAVILLITTINGFVRGFVDNVLKKLGWILAVVVSCMFYADVSVKLRDKIPNELLSKIVAFLLVFAVVYLLIMILKAVLGKLFSGEIMGGLDKGLGGLFGIIEGFAIAFFVIFLLNLQNIFDASSLVDGSIFNNLMGTLNNI